MGQIQIKQLKNRYNDVNMHKRFVVGIDRSKMKLYDVDQDSEMTDAGTVMDNTTFGERLDEDMGKTHRNGRDLLDKVKTLNF